MQHRVALAAVAAIVLMAACAREAETPAPSVQEPAEANRVAPRRVVLFFEGPRALLVPEPRDLPLPESDAATLHPLVAAFLAGPQRTPGATPLPADTILRGAFLLPGGTAVVDLGGETLQQGWSAGTRNEMLAAYGLVQTIVANVSSVERVHILIGGEVAPTLGGHLDLSRPLRPEAWLVDRMPVEPAPSP
ncbi:MAG: GerMN domain-containing protein [Thermoanaerobaculia bacterium]